MTAGQIIDNIHAARYTGLKNGLDNTRALFEKLGIAPDCLPVIHVAGTNGKGSVCAMLESALRRAGLKTGLYTSPFLQRYNERIAISGMSVSDETIERYGEKVLAANEAIGATAFELGTALAMLIFKGEGVDIAIMEVGLGGRLDPTNVILPKLSVITAIGLDHMDVLGDTVEKIALEKAGIIKSGVPVIVQPCEDSVYSVFEGVALEKGAPITRLHAHDIQRIESGMFGSRAKLLGLDIALPLPGDHQLANSLTAVAALKQCGIGDEAIQEGIANVLWPARLEWCGNILIDGAHNGHGAASLKRYADTYLQGKKRVLLTGVLSDKLTDDMVRALGGIADTILTVTPNSLKAVDADAFKACFKSAQSCESVQAGLKEAKRLAGEEGIVVVGGSLYLAGEVRTILGLKPR